MIMEELRLIPCSKLVRMNEIEESLFFQLSLDNCIAAGQKFVALGIRF